MTISSQLLERKLLSRQGAEFETEQTIGRKRRTSAVCRYTDTCINKKTWINIVWISVSSMYYNHPWRLKINKSSAPPPYVPTPTPTPSPTLELFVRMSVIDSPWPDRWLELGKLAPAYQSLSGTAPELGAGGKIKGDDQLSTTFWGHQFPSEPAPRDKGFETHLIWAEFDLCIYIKRKKKRRFHFSLAAG